MRKLIFLGIMLLTAAFAKADDNITFTASAPDVVVVGDQFRLSYTISTQKVKDFRAPSTMEGFDILMGPSASRQSSTQIINGNVSSMSSITYTYILKAIKEGTFSIPAATVVADGKQLISNAVNVRVLPPDQASGIGGDTNNSSGSGNTNRGQQSGSSGGSSSSSNDNTVSNQELFISSTVTKTNVYEQEAFLLTYKIYTQVQLTGFESVKWPDFKGFHSQEVELPSNDKWDVEHYNGRNYRTTIYRQFVLFPQQSGPLVIEPARFDATIAKAVRNVDPFDAFFNGRSNYTEIRKPIITPKITVNVSPLPAGKPSSFWGGVGNFSITSSINSQQVKTNDAITLKLVISGTGNMKLLSNPTVDFPSDFEVYDPKVDNKVRLTRDGLTGNKVIEYLAIPRHAGTFKIPAVEFSYFDIKAKTYKTLKTEEYEIQVQKGEGSSEQVIANFTNKEDLKVLGEDIRFIKLNDVKLQPKNNFFFGTMKYWLFYIIPALIFLVYFIIYRKQAAENANVAKVRTKKANKVATKRLKLAGKLLSENKKDAFYDEVLKALWGYISDKLNIPVSKLTKDNIEEKLRNHGVEEDLIKQFIDTLNECEFARFAPGDENKAMDHVYSSAMAVISKMESSIKR